MVHRVSVQFKPYAMASREGEFVRALAILCFVGIVCEQMVSTNAEEDDMATLWGRTWTRRELLEHVGDIGQIADVRKSVLADGNNAGVEVFDFTTGTGFAFTVAAGRALDVTAASYQGKPLAWRSSVGDVAGTYYDPEGLEWLRSFFGGLVATCGITYAGAMCTDEGKKLGIHGRIGNVPAKRVSFGGYWEGDEYILWVSGVMRESGLFQDELELQRIVSTRLGSNSFTIRDKVVNIGWHTSPLMILYHCNYGFPVVADGSEVLTPASKVTPRDAEARDGAENYYKLHEPMKDYKEKVYYHDVKAGQDGRTAIGVVNRRMGIGGVIRYKPEQLPRLIQWKQMGQGWYTCGLEPANCLVEGRDKDRAAGRLQFLGPQEERDFELELGVLTSAEEIKAFEAEVKKIKG